MNFASDNVSGASPEILAAVVAAFRSPAMPYGQDDITRRLDAVFSAVFETPVAVFPVVTGSAANGLALAALSPPHGAIYAHQESHINTDECGAPEFFTHGAKLVALPGNDGKIDPGALAHALAHSGRGMVHYVQPAALSLTQTTEAGTAYGLGEIAALAAVARADGLGVHMDGARFANAVAATGASPADLSWRAGVDVLCLGATKNGAVAAEAVIFFDPGKTGDFGFRRKRGGHLLSKLRFLSAQLEAYVADWLWLRNAAHANAMARRLAAGLMASGAQPVFPVEANEVFLHLDPARQRALEAAGAVFYPWPRLGPDVARFVTSFETRAEDVDRAITVAGARGSSRA